MSDGRIGPQGTLDAVVSQAPRPATVRSLRLPFGLGRIGHTTDKGNGVFGREVMTSHLHAIHLDSEGRVKGVHNLGSGTVTNSGVNMLALDSTAWSVGPILSKFNFHGVGTGATASAATDYWLQTAIASGSLTGSTNGYFTGAQSLAGQNIYKSVATVVFSATLAVTEWVLTMANGANITATMASTAAQSAVFPAATFTASAQIGWVIEQGSTGINTPTSTVMSTPITANTTTTCTLGTSPGGGWTTLANGAPSGGGPGAVAGIVVPGTWDHKQFSAINVNSGDSIQFTYQVTINSGG